MLESSAVLAGTLVRHYPLVESGENSRWRLRDEHDLTAAALLEEGLGFPPHPLVAFAG